MGKATVKATQKGHLGKLRYPGDVFEIDDSLFSKEWMVKLELDTEIVEEPKMPAPKRKPAAKAAESPDSE